MKKEQKARQLPHGGDWAGFEIEYGKEPLDFSMNVNPLGIPETVQQAIAKAGRSAHRYPDPLCRALTHKLAERECVPPEWIFCGNGAADIIFRLAQALKPAQEKDRRPTLMITAPTFSEYETAFAEYGWAIRRHLLKEEQGFRIGSPDQIDADVDAVFLCEPNNPTGVTTDRQVLQKILERCRKTGTWLIIDECFNGFLEDPASHSMKAELQKSGSDERDRGGLIILKAFTKLYGMAGVRLGYCLCADGSIIDRIRQAGAPWNVSGLAQAAGIAALDAEEHVAKGLQIVREERPWMKEQLERLGITPVYGEANYLLFRWMPEAGAAGSRAAEPADPVTGRTAGATAAEPPNPGMTGTADRNLDACLRSRGILIRSCSNYPGLGEDWYRIAVRTHEENERLMEALREITG